MIWAGLLLILTILFVVALFWKPGKQPSGGSIQSAVERMVSPSPRSSDPLETEIEIIAEALRQRDAAKRKAAAMARLRDLLTEE